MEKIEEGIAALGSGNTIVIGLSHARAVAAGPASAGEGVILHVLDIVGERVDAGAAEVVVVSGIGGGAFPTGEVGGDKGCDDGGEFVNYLPDLIFLPEEVSHFTDSVVIGGPEGGVAGVVASTTGGIEERIVNDIMAAVVGWTPAGIGVPGEKPKFPLVVICREVIGLKVVDHVLVRTGPVVVVAGGFDESVEGVEFFEIYMGVDVSRGVVAIEILLDGVVVASVEGGKSGLIALLFFPIASLVDELVEVAFFKVVFSEEADVVGFGDEVGALVVAAPLVGSFNGVIDNAPLDEERVGGRDAHFLKEVVVDGFVDSESHRTSIGIAFSEREGAPGLFEFFAALVAGFEEVSIVEAHAHGALAPALVAAVGSAKTETDVVVDLAVVDHAPVPVVEEAGFGALVDLVTAIVGDGFGVVFAASEKMVDGKSVTHRRGIDSLIGWNSVVNEVGEIEGGVVGIGNTCGLADAVGYCNAIADEAAVCGGGESDGEQVVSGESITTGSVIAHGNGGPVGFKGGILRAVHGGVDVVCDDGEREFAWDVGSGGDDAILEAD